MMVSPCRSDDGCLKRYLDGCEPHIIGIRCKIAGLHTYVRTLSLGEFTQQGRRKFTSILHDIAVQSPGRRQA